MDSPTLHFLGTGNAFNADGRGSQAVVVRPCGQGPFLVDLGPTVVAAVERFGVDTSELESVFITHLHGDHVAGWPFLLLRLAFIDRRDRPLEVVGPAGTKGCLEALMHHCYDDLADKLGFELSYRELPIARATDLVAGKTRFDVLPMDHHPTSVAYRFDVGGRRVGISGDTRWCSGLEQLARESDILVLECSSVAKQPLPHVALDEIREHRERLGPCEIVLIHLTDEVAAQLATCPIPGIVASYDGMLLSL